MTDTSPAFPWHCTECKSPTVNRKPVRSGLAGRRLVRQPGGPLEPWHCSKPSCKYANPLKVTMGWFETDPDAPRP